MQTFTLIGGQIVNELDSFVIVCSIRSPRPGNITIHNQNTNETVKIGYNVYSVNFIENSAQCYQTASFVCLAGNNIGRTQSHPLDLYVKCNGKQHPNYFACFGINYRAPEYHNEHLIFLSYRQTEIDG